MSQESTPYSSESPVVAPAPRRSRAWIFWLIGAISVLLVACCGIAAFSGFRLFQTAQGEVDQTIVTIDQFMHAGVQRDIPAATSLFASSADVSTPDINTLFNERADVFAGYTQARQTSFNINTGTSGTIARIEGTLSYTAHADRKFSATLRKENKQWRIVRIEFSEGVGT